MSEVLLIGLPQSHMSSSAKIPPLGILYLASTLDENGIDVKVLDLNIESYNKKNFLRKILKENPKIIGISSNSYGIREAVTLAKTIKDSGVESKVVLGGTHISSSPNFIEKFGMFDYGFIGEAEISFPVFVKKILKGKSNKGKKFFCKHPDNLDNLPLPSYKKLNLKKYRDKKNKLNLNIVSSRGCSFECIYCHQPKISPLRFRSGSNVAEEIRILIENYKADYLYFTDGTFNINKKHALAVCKAIIEEKIDIEWGCCTRCDCVNKEILKIMYKAGCRDMGFGIESGSEKVRSILKKKSFSNKLIFNTFKLCRENNVRTIAWFMLGLPTENLNGINNTIKFAIKLNANRTIFSPLVLLPNTEIFNMALKEGMIDNDVWDKYATGESRNIPIFIPKNIEKKQLEKMLIKACISFYGRPSYIVKNLDKIVNIKDFIKSIISFKTDQLS